jgi:hypothetical protein
MSPCFATVFFSAFQEIIWYVNLVSLPYKTQTRNLNRAFVA